MKHALISHVMFQAYSAIFTTLNIVRHICPHQVSFGRFRQIQNPGIVVQLDILMYITSSVKWSDPGHFPKAQGKFIFSFPCTLFLHIFDT